MKKAVPNGKAIKALRMDLEKGSTQKEFAYEVRISERKLRQIENEDAAISADVLERIAKALNVHRQQIVAAGATSDGSRGPDVFAKILDEMDQEQLIPRWDEELASFVSDEHTLYTEASRSYDASFEIKLPLTVEIADYVEELSEILNTLTWACPHVSADEARRDEIQVRRRIRELLVLLKRNDVWVYVTWTLRRLPERLSPLPAGQHPEIKSRLVVAFGPPGEYGETSIRVAVDHGQPFILPAWPMLRDRLDAK